MHILLSAAGILGKDEFVTTAAPNVYITVLRITPEQAAHFGGNERIGIETVIEEDNAKVVEVYGVGEDNRSNDWRISSLGAKAFNPERSEILYSLEDREFEAIQGFLEAVPHAELEAMYGELAGNDLMSKLLKSLEEL